MNGLELINTIDGKWSWLLDYGYTNGQAGTYAESIDYDSEKDAINALIGNKIEWPIHKSYSFN